MKSHLSLELIIKVDFFSNILTLQGLRDKCFPVNFVNENPLVPTGMKMSCLVFSDLV